MKKCFGTLMIALLMLSGLISCKKDKTTETVNSYLVKTISFTADWNGGTSGYDFVYNSNKQVTSFDRTFDGGADGSFVYDFSVPGKLTITKDGSTYGSYDINNQGYITKEDWGNGEYASYEYDANGYLVKYYEFWGGVNHLKYDIEISNGNITKWTTYGDDGVTATKVKEFFYTAGKNLNGIHQANATDSDWKPVGNFYGKPSINLLDHFDYWDPRVSPVSKSTSTFTYEFDSKDRPSKVTKTLTDMSTEVWDYTYYEN